MVPEKHFNIPIP